MINTRLSTPTRSNDDRASAKTWLLRAVSIALCAIMAACGTPAPSAEPIPMTPTVTQAVEVEQGLEADTPQAGGELRVYVPQSTRSLDPLASNRTEVSAMLSLVYEKLIMLDGSLRLTPSLAESWDPVDESGKTWKIALRKGVTWQGTDEPFTARDVLFTLNLLHSEYYEDSPYAYHLDWIEALTAPDDYTLMLTAAHPGAQVLHALTFPIVSRKHFAYGKQPVGTGPYVMDKAEPRVGFHLRINDSWWRTAPHIQSITALCVDDSNTALLSLQEGLLNYVPIQSGTVASYREIGDVGVLQSRTRQSEALLINHGNAFLQNVNVRKAIAYAIDRRGIISKSYLGRAFATDVPISPSSWLYAADLKTYDYNPDLAKELLSEAGWVDLDADGIVDRQSDGSSIVTLKLSLLVNDTPESAYRKDVANQIRQNLRDVGIDVTVVAARWSGNQNEYGAMLEARSFDLALAGFNMDPCPDLTEFIGTDGHRNYGKFANTDMDAALEAFRSASEESDTITLSRNVQRMFISELPYVHLYFIDAAIVYNADLQFPSDTLLDINDESPYAGIEKWYFDVAGRARFEPLERTIGTRWSSFDNANEALGVMGTDGLMVEPPLDGATASPTPSATPSATPTQTPQPRDDDDDDRRETDRPRSTPRPTARPTEKPASTPAPTPKPTPQPTEKPKSTPKPTKQPEPEPEDIPEDVPEDVPEDPIDAGRPTKKPQTPKPSIVPTESGLQ